MKLYFQITLCALFLLGLIRNIYYETRGRPAQAPGGFSGMMSTLIAFIVVPLIQWMAGSFSMLF